MSRINLQDASAPLLSTRGYKEIDEDDGNGNILSHHSIVNTVSTRDVVERSMSHFAICSKM